MERRLAAIMATDVVGYSRLIRDDEEGTLAALNALRGDLIHPKIAEHHGRIVKLMGDGMLAEFASVVDAVRAAVETQQAVAERNAELPEDKRIAFRVGINLGDVVIDGDDIQGDGVNVAARLEGLADPGSVYISGGVHEQVRDRVDLAFEDLGEQGLKNIDRPMRVWRWAAGSSLAPPGSKKEPASLALPDKPSIAVLPFDNMSGDPEQEYFADGMVEEIITALTRFDWLFVIARNSSFTYKGRAVDVRQVASELGVRYVLEGSVRKAARRVRITGQLIDASSGAHIWADRFDGDLEDIFDLQDRITETVVGAIEPQLRKAEIERSKRKRPENLDAYDLYLRALPHLYIFNHEANTEALALLEKAVALDPGYAPALATAAWCIEQRLTQRWPTAREGDAEQALELARAALALDSDDANAMAIAGFVLLMVGRDYDRALAAAERALGLTPNSATVCWAAGWINCVAGDPETALQILERALRLSPSDPQIPFILTGIAVVYLLRGRYPEAADIAARSAALRADFSPAFGFLACACGYLGRTDEAKAAISKLISFVPGATISLIRETLPVKEQNRLEILLDGLRKAGLPE